VADKRIEVSGLSFHVVDEGDGAPVLLLHGFPDSTKLWRHQIPALVAAGYRVIAPDLRGFGESAKPAGVEAYRGELLLGDVIGLLGALGVQRTHVVGHDWGAFMAWMLAGFAPPMVESLTVLSVGHPASFFGTGLDQREKSWYMLLFQFDIAEQLLRADDWKLFRDFTRHHGELDRWIADLERPGALTAALNWYRANANPATPLDPASLPRVRARTLGIWSSLDHYLTEVQMVGSSAFVDGPWRYVRVEGASHWLQVDRPTVVNELLLGFLKG
jgi:pimeloyl-ACP methyl ester carboxylesterase